MGKPELPTEIRVLRAYGRCFAISAFIFAGGVTLGVLWQDRTIQDQHAGLLLLVTASVFMVLIASAVGLAGASFAAKRAWRRSLLAKPQEPTSGPGSV